jgi:hypothetical protein
MPKPVKKRRPSNDPKVLAFDMVRRSLEAQETPTPAVPDFKEQLSAYMSKLGKKGGKASGAKRMEMPADERRAIASKAARARWRKRKAAKKR